MVINAQEVGDPRLHTVVQANIRNPRSNLTTIYCALRLIP